ncbi:MAG: two-component system, cell cycle response regulator [Solirubrobacteraceae bacterium]|nr:two-component system, cell cycle response regulator [Solirubrobacteraceae bacterium]
MHQRLRFARVATIVVGAALSLTLALSTNAGLEILAALVTMVAVVLIGGRNLDQRRRPELWVFFSTVVNIQVMLTLGSILVGGPKSSLVCTLAVPVIMVAARFSNRVLIIGAPISALLILIATVGVDPGYVAAHPESVVVPLVLVLCIAIYLSPLVASDVRHRVDSTLDQLTGLLNRRALGPRFAEVAEQAALTGMPVSVVMMDIDHFKRINDVHGHAMGDTVLRDVAAAMRQHLRTFELVYRMGGEEFLLLLPGDDAATAVQVAERLRLAIEQLQPEGLDLTCSFGVASATGGEAALAKLLSGADLALYDAKRFGRNRVECYGAAAPLAA